MFWENNHGIYVAIMSLGHNELIKCVQSITSLQWRHNGPDCVSNHQPHDCLLKPLIRRSSKQTSKLRVTGLWVGNSPGTGEFPAQRASNAENAFIWWRHHVMKHSNIEKTEFRRYQLPMDKLSFKPLFFQNEFQPFLENERIFDRINNNPLQGYEHFRMFVLPK